MRTKLLRCRENVTVQLVYPSTLEEYRQVLEALGSAGPAVVNGEPASAPAESEAAKAAYVVTTAQQRYLWGLPDVAVSGRSVPLDEVRALDLLHDAVVNSDRAAELFPRRSPEVVPGPDVGASGGSWFDAVRGFLSPGARVDQAVEALDRAGLPGAVRDALSDQLTDAFRPGAKLAEGQLERVRVLLDLPWAKCELPAVRPRTRGAGAAVQLTRPSTASRPASFASWGRVRRRATCSPSRVRARAVETETEGLPALVVCPGQGLRPEPPSSALPVPGGPARRRSRTRSRRLSAGSR